MRGRIRKDITLYNDAKITGHAVGKNGAHPTSQYAKTTTTAKTIAT